VHPAPIQTFFKGLSDLPEGLPKSHHRWFLFSQYGCAVALALHILFLIAFLLLHINILALFNIGSVIIFSSCIALNLRGRLKLSVVLIVFEVTTHQALAIWLLGWDAGFQYYIMCLAMVIFFTPWKQYIQKSVFIFFLFRLQFHSISPFPCQA